MSYQLTPVPYSLALAHGFMSKTDKSKGMHHFEADTGDAMVTPYANEILVTEDGNAVFHRLRQMFWHCKKSPRRIRSEVKFCMHVQH